MAEAVSPGRRQFRPLRRVVARAARLLARGIYRSVAVDNPESGWSERPAVLVANHPTGFSDPALLMGLLERSPRFMAKAPLWDTPGVGWFLDRLGAIPVYRAQDGSMSRNDEMFSAGYRALSDGDLIALFPEGRVHDEPRIGPVKTGASRLALGARASGVRGILVVPVGLHFEDKAGLRSRAYVRVGDVIDLDTEVEEITGSGHPNSEDFAAVEALTDEIERRLRDSAPDYRNDAEARSLALASDVALREPGMAYVSYSARQRLADIVADAETQRRRRATTTADVYAAVLESNDISDGDVMLAQGGVRMGYRLAGLVATVVLLAPFATIGIALNLAPYLVLRSAMRIRSEAMTPSTTRMVAAVVSFFAMWLIWAAMAWSTWNWRVGLVTFVACPIYGGIAVSVIDQAVRWWRDWTGRRRGRRLGAAMPDVLERRHAVCTAVEEAVGA